MKDFQKQLDSELEKRGLKEPEKEKAGVFSIMAFFQGLFLCFFASSILIGWAAYWSEVTYQNISEKLPSKTAIVKTGSDPVLRVGGTNSQPTLTMPPPQDTTPEIEQPADEEKPVEIIETPEVIDAIPLEKVEKNNKGMVPAPVPGLFENTTSGQIPKIRSEDNLTAFKAYKHPFIKDANKPSLSIVITNLGLSEKMLNGVIENFPDEISIGLHYGMNDITNADQTTAEQDDFSVTVSKGDFSLGLMGSNDIGDDDTKAVISYGISF